VPDHVSTRIQPPPRPRTTRKAEATIVVEIRFEFLRDSIFEKIDFAVSIFIRIAIEIRYARTTDATRPVSRCSNHQSIDARVEKKFFETLDDKSCIELDCIARRNRNATTRR